MSVVSENHGGPDAPELANLRHACAGCGRSLAGGSSVAHRGLDYCGACVLTADWSRAVASSGRAGYRAGLIARNESEPEPDCDRFD